MKPGKNSVQVIIGTKVQFVADEFSNFLRVSLFCNIAVLIHIR